VITLEGISLCWTVEPEGTSGTLVAEFSALFEDVAAMAAGTVALNVAATDHRGGPLELAADATDGEELALLRGEPGRPHRFRRDVSTSPRNSAGASRPLGELAVLRFGGVGTRRIAIPADGRRLPVWSPPVTLHVVRSPDGAAIRIGGSIDVSVYEEFRTRCTAASPAPCSTTAATRMVPEAQLRPASWTRGSRW